MIDSKQRLIAIMRGVKPNEVEDMTKSLIDAGIRALEITMNSPSPLESIEIAVKVANRLAPNECLVGAGTVLNVEQVDQVKALGGNMIVSPDTNPDVIDRTVALGMKSFPGVFSPSEAFTALRHGASGLKFFPASALGPDTIKAIRAVLPQETQVFAVGGAGPDDFKTYESVGVDGFGLGSNLYKAGRSAVDVGERAKAAVAKLHAVYGA